MIRNPHVLTAGFAIVLLLWVADLLVPRATYRKLQEAQQQVTRVDEIREDLAQLADSYMNAEAGQRGYLLTGNKEYLKPYSDALDQLDGRIARVRAEINDPSAVNEILELGRRKIVELRSTLTAYDKSGPESALAIVRTNVGENYMENLRSLVTTLDHRLRLESDEIVRKANSAKLWAEWTAWFTKGVIGVALITLFFVLRRIFALRERALLSEQRARATTARALASERAAHSEAAHANRLKDEFLGVVSHELRTPLTAILAWTTLLRQGADDEAELAEGLETIERNARAQTRLVEDLLDVSRIISGKVRLQITEVNLRDVMTSVLEVLRPSAVAKGITLESSWSDEAAEILGDADRMQQIGWNLISNAIKFTPQGGRVRVSLARLDSTVQLEVQDTGRGIKKEFVDRIFDRFTQENTGTDRENSGLGLGLAITRHLVEMHGGRISVSSEGEGRGTTFRVQIPIVAVRELRQQFMDRKVVKRVELEEQVLRSQGSLRGVRILAVDDQVDALAIYRRVLSRAGAEVRTAENVAKALLLLESWQPDILVSDIGMPGEDGYSFIRRIRQRPPDQGGRLPALALTAFAKREDYARAIEAGFNDHLSKPVDAGHLTSKLAELVRHQNA